MTASVLSQVQHYDSVQGAVTGSSLCESGVAPPRDFTESNFAFRVKIQLHSCGPRTHHRSSLTPFTELSIVKEYVAKGRAGFSHSNISAALSRVVFRCGIFMPGRSGSPQGLPGSVDTGWLTCYCPGTRLATGLWVEPLFHGVRP